MERAAATLGALTMLVRALALAAADLVVAAALARISVTGSLRPLHRSAHAPVSLVDPAEAQAAVQRHVNATVMCRQPF